MGTPVITLAGTRHGTRFGLSLLENVGLGELAAQTPPEYIEKAAALASDRELLTALHRNLRPMMQRSPVMDGRGYVREVEAMYEKIWSYSYFLKPISSFFDIETYDIIDVKEI